MVADKEVMDRYISRLNDWVDYLKDEGATDDYLAAFLSGYLAGSEDTAKDINEMVHEIISGTNKNPGLFIKSMKGLTN